MKLESMMKKDKKIKLLDIVNFVDRNSNQTFKAKITELSYFNNFKEAIQEVGVKKVLPNAKSLKEAIEIYNSFPHSDNETYKDAAKKYGVLRMKFKLIK